MNVVWLKKDLRLADNEALTEAAEHQFLILYIFEPSVAKNYDWDIRHWRFAYQSLKDLQAKGAKVHFLYGEALQVFEFLIKKYPYLEVFSHCETGNDLTYSRDLSIAELLAENDVEWNEFQNNMVIRGLKNRHSWDSHWTATVSENGLPPPSLSCQTFDRELHERFSLPQDLVERLEHHPPLMLDGGESKAWERLESFISFKVENYWGSIGSPELSRKYCSLLSPHITWGNLSIRQIHQYCEKRRPWIGNKQSLEQFQARLKWHCHFIQKLEMEPRIEFENLNRAYDDLRSQQDPALVDCWERGRTGFPLVDAAMRCVTATGYINFRLRSTVVSFFTHLLWQPWQAGAGFLARQFLDYEPGIHFSQMQMQAGTTGINTIRIYNPVKQSREKDPEGVFIKKWVPELAEVPPSQLHDPWNLTSMEQMMYGVRLGESYPRPIVELESAYRNAKDILWRVKGSRMAQKQSQSILQKHARRNRRES